MRGQLAHYGHEIDPKYVPIPAMDRDLIKRLLLLGHRPDDIPGIVRQCKLLAFDYKITVCFSQERHAAWLLR